MFIIFNDSISIPNTSLIFLNECMKQYSTRLLCNEVVATSILDGFIFRDLIQFLENSAFRNVSIYLL
jgi:hypothetical protein